MPQQTRQNYHEPYFLSSRPARMDDCASYGILSFDRAEPPQRQTIEIAGKTMKSGSEITFDTLFGLRAAESSTIVGVTAAQRSAKRLADMGFVSGARIEMIRPGNPCLVRIGGTCVGLGTANQRCILIADRTKRKHDNTQGAEELLSAHDRLETA